MTQKQQSADTKLGVASVAQDIYDHDGSVTASSLVDAAAAPDSPAHPAFEWDDSVAGHQYRLVQARGWLRRIRVVVDGEKQELIHVPAVTTAEGVYKPLSVVACEPEEYQRALNQTRQHLQAASRAMQTLEKAARGVAPHKTITALRRAARHLGGAQTSLEQAT